MSEPPVHDAMEQLAVGWKELSATQKEKAAALIQRVIAPLEVERLIKLTPAETITEAPSPPPVSIEMPPKPWPPIRRRNLLFYIFPLKNPSRVWQWHVERICRYLPIFNGQQIIAIATDPSGELPLHPAEEVRAAFGKAARKIKFIEVPNDALAWEAPALALMLSMVESSDRNEASFYFHAKGVRRHDQTAVRPWCEAIYDRTLSEYKTALESLAHAKTCGIILRCQDPTGARSGDGEWHFSGNGWWARHDALFVSGWGDTLQYGRTHGAESFVATRFERHEAHEIMSLPNQDVYRPDTWARERATAVSIIVTARNNGRYLRECLESCLWQDCKAHEVIYCDDASQDDSLDIANTFYGLKIIHLKKHLGVIAARNHAASQATGNALLFVDGDNILPRNFLSVIVPMLDYRTPFVYTDLSFFGRETAYHRQPDWWEFDLWQENHCDTCSLIRRHAFDLAGGWIDEANGKRWCAMEDYHLFLRLSFFGAARRAPVALGYRRHDESLSFASGREGNTELLFAAQDTIRENVRAWAINQFGRVPNRAERDNGVLLGTVH